MDDMFLDVSLDNSLKEIQVWKLLPKNAWFLSVINPVRIPSFLWTDEEQTLGIKDKKIVSCKSPYT